MGGAAALPAHDSLQVIDVLDDPYELLGLHEVEGDSAGDVLALGDDAHGYVADHRRLDDGGVRAVQVDVLGSQSEAVQVPVKGVLLVEGDDAVLDGSLDGGLLNQSQGEMRRRIG